MGNMFGFTRSPVERFLKSEGLIVPREITIAFRTASLTGRTTATPEEDAKIKAEYLLKPVKTLASEMDRGYTFVTSRLKHLGLVIPPHIIAERKLASRIQPGNIPINKGKKQVDYMSAEAIERTAKTRFTKGITPHNTKYDGFERVTKDGYIEIRIAKGVFKLKHRVEWEKVNGKIPNGYLIVCKNGNLQDTSPRNWELISRIENMARNSGSINLTDNMVASYLATSSKKCDYGLKQKILTHPELIKAKKNQLLINRKIKNYGTQQNHGS